MQPYIPYFVIEALVSDRVREIQGLNREPAFRAIPVFRRRLGALLVRLGSWLQDPMPNPVPNAI